MPQAVDYDALAKSSGAVVDFDALAAEHGGSAPDFTTTNEKPSASLWEKANTPLIPQIQQAAHAISDYLSQPRLNEAQMNEHVSGIGTLSAALRGGAAGAVEGAGDLLSGFTSPVGVALFLSGLSSESAIAKAVPGLRSLLELPAVKGLQRAVQGGAGAAFAGHGAAQVATAPTLAGKAQGVVEAATGALPTPSTASPLAHGFFLNRRVEAPARPRCDE